MVIRRTFGFEGFGTEKAQMLESINKIGKKIEFRLIGLKELSL